MPDNVSTAQILSPVTTAITGLQAELVKQQAATNDLTEKIKTLTAWMLGFTIVIGAMTAVQLLVALNLIGCAR